MRRGFVWEGKGGKGNIVLKNEGEEQTSKQGRRGGLLHVGYLKRGYVDQSKKSGIGGGKTPRPKKVAKGERRSVARSEKERSVVAIVS